MSQKQTDPTHQGLALAALFSALARTLGRRDEAFLREFATELDGAYRQVRDSGLDDGGALETISWVREMVKR